MLWKCCTQYASRFGKLSSGHKTGKCQVFIPVPKKGNAKECSNYCTIALTSHASQVMLKILQARLQQYVNHELQDVQAEFQKGKGTRDQIANICWIIKKQENSRIASTFALLTTLKPFWLCSVQFSRSVVSDSLWPHGHGPPGSSIHGILQARILEWVSISFSSDKV